jgi:hypothetical protein
MTPLAPALEAVREAWQTAGRATAPHLSTSMWFALGEDAEQTVKGYVAAYLDVFGSEIGELAASVQRGYDAGVMREAVDAATAAGCDELFLVPTSTDVRQVDLAVEALGL